MLQGGDGNHPLQRRGYFLQLLLRSLVAYLCYPHATEFQVKKHTSKEQEEHSERRAAVHCKDGEIAMARLRGKNSGEAAVATGTGLLATGRVLCGIRTWSSDATPRKKLRQFCSGREYDVDVLEQLAPPLLSCTLDVESESLGPCALNDFDVDDERELTAGRVTGSSRANPEPTTVFRDDF